MLNYLHSFSHHNVQSGAPSNNYLFSQSSEASGSNFSTLLLVATVPWSLSADSQAQIRRSKCKRKSHQWLKAVCTVWTCCSKCILNCRRHIIQFSFLLRIVASLEDINSFSQKNGTYHKTSRSPFKWHNSQNHHLSSKVVFYLTATAMLKAN